ncbi:MAG: helix-turn-helix transcriptional regulator [Clostridia bacterium]|nr:helix-turn-helix transcriptional regulator [Clostridia bacterium]
MLNLKEIREEKNLQQKEIAERLNRTPACISSWETGKTEPSIDDLVKLADLLEVSLDYLLCRTDESGVVEEIRNYSPLHKKMLSLFEKLSQEDRLQTLGFMQALLR